VCRKTGGCATREELAAERAAEQQRKREEAERRKEEAEAKKEAARQAELERQRIAAEKKAQREEELRLAKQRQIDLARAREEEERVRAQRAVEATARNPNPSTNSYPSGGACYDSFEQWGGAFERWLDAGSPAQGKPQPYRLCARQYSVSNEPSVRAPPKQPGLVAPNAPNVHLNPNINTSIRSMPMQPPPGSPKVETSIESPQSLVFASPQAGVNHTFRENSATPRNAADVLSKMEAIRFVRYAEMARDAYENPNKSTFAPVGYQRDSNWWDYFKRAGFNQAEIDRIEKSGFSATIYRQNGPGEIVIAFRGTELDLQRPSRDHWRDAKTDVSARLASEPTSEVPQQYVAAAELARIVRRQGVPVVLTGHSLGGGLATYAGNATDLANVKIVTFNGARSPYTSLWNNQNQTNFIVLGDFIGDPNSKRGNIGGVGSLPGANMLIQSSTDKHGIDGIIAGLSDIARVK
jgi:hypothetical protein